VIRITLEVCTQVVLALYHSYSKTSQAEDLNYDLALSPPAFHCQLFLNVLSKTWQHNRIFKSGKNDVQITLDVLLWLIPSTVSKQPVSLPLGFSSREIASHHLILFSVFLYSY